MMFGSYKTMACGLLTAVLIGSIAGCQKGETAGGTSMADPDEAVYDPRSADAGQASALEELDLGQDWEPANEPGDGADRAPAAPADSASGARPRPSRSFWTVVLGTYDHDQAVQAANTMLKELQRLDPMFQQAWVRETSKGAMVILGRFDSPGDEQAQQTLKQVKNVEYKGRKALPRAMLSRIRPDVDPQQRSPLHLLSVRRQYPNVDPLYTLDVAIWSDFGSGEMSWQEIRQKTIAYTRELRGKGFQAYYYFDEDQRIGQVTVGVWGSKAVDRRSGFMHAEVRKLMNQFQHRLVNGDPLREPIDPDNPDRGTRLQSPRLVLVPKP